MRSLVLLQDALVLLQQRLPELFLGDQPGEGETYLRFAVLELASARALGMLEDVDRREGPTEVLHRVARESHVEILMPIHRRVFLHLVVVHQPERPGHFGRRTAGASKIRGRESQLHGHRTFELLEVLAIGEPLRDVEGVFEVLFFFRQLLEPVAQLLDVVPELIGEIQAGLTHQRPVLTPARDALERQRDEDAHRDERQVDGHLLVGVDRAMRRVNLQGADIITGMRVPYPELHDALRRALETTGLAPERADLSARLIADASRDGVHSHGLNLFPRLMRMIRAGTVDVSAVPERIAASGAVERWDGRRGVGNLNAHHSMAAAIALAREHGLGCVALANTNHWMRGGSYGWQAADAGVIGICWTNTMPNLPPWGASEPRLGNNPLVIAVPRAEGQLVLDMAMSPFSYGTLESHRMRGEQLPVIGGFNLNGELTCDPGAIEISARPLPIGYWKGSGLALMLDLLASLLSGGQATHQITPDSLQETGLSQVFLAFDLSMIGKASDAENVTNQIVASIQGSTSSMDERVRYPGERTLEIR